ncbi:MAG: PilZ domain-containing protein [Polyangiaceae bacterium]
MVPSSAVKSRPPTVSSTPPSWTPRRNVGGARREATERVSLKAPGFETSGWTLNISRGGVRAILEEKLTPGVEYEIVVGDAPTPRRAELVWSQEQADGQIVGLKFLDLEATLPPRDGSTPPQDE